MPSSPVAERRRASRARAALASLALFAIGGCGGGPAPRLYVLEPPPASTAPDARDGEAAAEGSTLADGERASGVPRALGTAVVSLPGYARDPRIASRDGGIGVSLDDDDRWAEDPEEAITRALLASLRRHGAETVLIEPWPRGFEPEARVEVAFDRLLREPSGGAEASGRILLLSGDGRAVLGVLSFRLSRRAESSAPAAFFGAVAELVDEIARLAAEALARAFA